MVQIVEKKIRQFWFTAYKAWDRGGRMKRRG